MSREITERILRLIEQFALDYHRKECAAQISTYVERLLADEREKVREVILAEITGGRTVTNLGHVPAVARALHWIISDIRQLDLTAAYTTAPIDSSIRERQTTVIHRETTHDKEKE